MTIPQRIIQTNKTRDLLPFAKAGAANLKLLHPDWEHLFFDDEEVGRFISSEFPKYKGIFESFPRKIQRFDFFRYLAIYRFGGFYFDLDVFLYEDLGGLLAHGGVFPFEELTLNRFLRNHLGIDWEIGNYAFGASARHPFMEAAIENCVRAQRDPGWLAPMMKGIPPFFRSEFYVLNTTGPGLLTRTLVENPGLRKSVTVLFPDDVCDSRTWHQFGRYGVHLMNGSWRERGNFLWRRLAMRWESSVRRRMLAQSQTLGKTRSQFSERTA